MRNVSRATHAGGHAVRLSEKPWVQAVTHGFSLMQAIVPLFIPTFRIASSPPSGSMQRPVRTWYVSAAGWCGAMRASLLFTSRENHIVNHHPVPLDRANQAWTAEELLAKCRFGSKDRPRTCPGHRTFVGHWSNIALPLDMGCPCYSEWLFLF